MMDEAAVEQMSLYYQKTLLLTKRLKESERSLASMTQDNETRIAQLQTFVDDMNNNINNQKKEIMEFKGKEKNSLDQISAVCNELFWPLLLGVLELINVFVFEHILLFLSPA